MQKITDQDFIDKYISRNIDLQAESHLRIRVGQLEMELKLTEDGTELLMRTRYLGVSDLLKEKFEVGWHKTAWQAKKSSLIFSLCLPDLPVVLKPDLPQKIIQGQTIFAYCSMPLSVELSVDGTKIGEYPTRVLSKTWFGDPTEGVLSYSLKSEVVSDRSNLPQSPVHAICALEVCNKSSELLYFDRLCLRTEFMGLFKQKNSDHLSTSKCRLNYIGKERVSRINYLTPDSNCQLVTAPRNKGGYNSILLKSFTTI